jgi:diaminopimelate epimerase
MQIEFTKMVGAGNDFIVIDNRDGIVPDGDVRHSLIERWCERRMAVGADGVLLLEHDDEVDFRMRYYNADGGEAEMCGNGARCISRYAHLRGAVGTTMQFRSAAGLHTADITDLGVRVGLTDPTDIRPDYAVMLSDGEHVVSSINTGVPHVIEVVDDVDAVDVVSVGREIRYHDEFAPAGVNANFITVVDRTTFKIRTYERGVEDETLACGTGTTGAAIVGTLLGLCDSPVTGITRSGLPLIIDFKRNADMAMDVTLEGKADIAYEGILRLGE